MPFFLKDRAGNKLYERALHAESRSSLYQPFASDGTVLSGYDSADRLRQYQRGVLSPAVVPYRSGPGASIATPITLPGTDQTRTYDLDGLGNWKNTDWTLVGSGGTTTSTKENRQHNYVNEITRVRDVAGTTITTPFTYDHGNNAASDDPLVQVRGNGNLVSDGVRIYQWDAFNRLIQVNSGSDNTTLATYVYDALGRRVQKTVSNGGLTGDIPNGSTDYLYDGQQIVEERDDATDEWSQAYFWGQYVDELLEVASAGGVIGRVFSDLLYRGTAMVNTFNAVSEAYDTDAYGNTLCYSGPGTGGNWWADNAVRTNNPINPYIFTGREFDPETQIYYYRARYYAPEWGRFLSRDTLPKAELIQGPNLYQYVSSNAVNRTDPRGLDGGVWTFKVTPPASIFGRPLIEASYDPSADDFKCCDAIEVHRRATQGFRINVDDDSPTLGKQIAIPRNPHATADNDNPGGTVGFGPSIIPTEIVFEWNATCTKGKRAGEIVSTEIRIYEVWFKSGTLIDPDDL